MSTAQSQMFSFGDQLQEFARVTKERLGTVHKNISIKLFTSIVYDTPVLTGVARGSWNPSHGHPTEGGRVDPTGSLTVALINQTITDDWHQVSYFISNLPYIIPLEYGSSKKSPGGMVRLNISRFQGIVSEEVRKVKAGVK